MTPDVRVSERVECPTCKGSGIQWEHHGPGLNEPLGCDDCEGAGTAPRFPVPEEGGR